MSKILNIISYPNPILRQKSTPVNKKDIVNGKYHELVEDMTATMLKKDGVGLAAPQIAVNIRFVVIQYKKNTMLMFNPEITKKSWAKNIGEEGCLSVPNVFGNVKRHSKITCSYIDQNGEKKKIFAKDMLARILQHEVDHLDGVLFIDKLENDQHIEELN